MLGRTHFAGGMAAGAAVGMATGHPVLGMVLGGIGGLLPDIDHPGSLLGRALPFISIPIAILFKHRTITHTVWFAIGMAGLPVLLILLFSYAGYSVNYDTYLTGAYLLNGSISHLVLDAPTNSGIVPFWPIPIRIKGPLKTGDELIELPLTAVLVVLALNLSGIMVTGKWY